MVQETPKTHPKRLSLLGLSTSPSWPATIQFCSFSIPRSRAQPTGQWGRKSVDCMLGTVEGFAFGKVGFAFYLTDRVGPSNIIRKPTSNCSAEPDSFCWIHFCQLETERNQMFRLDALLTIIQFCHSHVKCGHGNMRRHSFSCLGNVCLLGNVSGNQGWSQKRNSIGWFADGPLAANNSCWQKELEKISNDDSSNNARRCLMDLLV